MSERSASYYINLVLQSQGEAGATIASLQQIGQVGDNINITFNETNRVAQRSGRQFGRLALDLRLVSSGARMLRQEIGGTSAELDAIVSVINGVTGSISLMLGATRLMTSANAAIAASVATTTAYMQAQVVVEEANAAMTAILAAEAAALGFTEAQTAAFIAANSIAMEVNTTLTMKAAAAQAMLTSAFMTFWPVLAVVAAIGIGKFLFDMASGAAEARREIEALTDANKELDVTLLSLKSDYSSLIAEQAGYKAGIADVNAEIAQLGETDERINRLKVLNNQLANVRARIAAVDVSIKGQERQEAELTARIASREMELENIGRRAFGGQAGTGGSTPDVSGYKGAQAGAELTKTGLIYAHKGEVVAPREQVPRLAGGGGDTNLTISMAGANIYGSEGVRQALVDGANAAMSTIKTKQGRLNFLRSPEG